MTKPIANPTPRSLRGRLGAATTYSRYAASEITAPGRAAFLSRFEREVDPDGVLDPEDRAMRAAHARKAHMLRLAMASAKARAEKAAARRAARGREAVAGGT